MNKRAIFVWVGSLSMCLLLASFVWSRHRENRDALSVRLVPSAKDPARLFIHFENRSSRPVKILRPLIGAEGGTRMPYYHFIVASAEGHRPVTELRCGTGELPGGLVAGRKWPDSYVVEIPPGGYCDESLSLKLATKPGVYIGTFTYTFDPVGLEHRVPEIKYPGDIWVGSVTAKPIRIVYENPDSRYQWCVPVRIESSDAVPNTAN